MLERKNLSKIKYIYRIYEAKGILHLEKYPVIYINSHYVYYKTPGKEMLDDVRMDRVYDDFIVYHRGWFNRYFWNISTDVKVIFEDLKRQQAGYDKKVKREKHEELLKQIQKEYEKIERLKQELEKYKV